MKKVSAFSLHFIRKLIIVIFFRRICFLYFASRRNYIIRSINRSRVSLFFWISWQWQRCWWTCSTYARTTSWWATETTGSKKVMSIIIFLPLSSLIRYTFLAEILLSLYLSISLYIYIYIYISVFFFLFYSIGIHWFLLHRDQSVPSCATFFYAWTINRLKGMYICNPISNTKFFFTRSIKKEKLKYFYVLSFYRNLFE